ncbi:MAG: hypothetical protein WA117_07160 [Verrucomicrobiia bacterium]
MIYSPLGSSFTANTAPLADRTGAIICATDDFSRRLKLQPQVV